MLFEINYLDFILQRVDFDALAVVENQVAIISLELHSASTRTGDGLQAFFLSCNENMGAFQVGRTVFVDEKNAVATG